MVMRAGSSMVKEEAVMMVPEIPCGVPQLAGEIQDPLAARCLEVKGCKVRGLHLFPSEGDQYEEILFPADVGLGMECRLKVWRQVNGGWGVLFLHHEVMPLTIPLMSHSTVLFRSSHFWSMIARVRHVWSPDLDWST
eukprot:CAMPEP_0113585156 /NCGR_PEP_ID=MMETSP0015_2-20120614/33524_1 /TAXON_ID=2838 /ORGANISM="Odontella" /LENGTH=136 /DNA_ID=CAMNT_0000490329 /DNA_START=55 /DNA_END=465 /DNA_ORIENTATION=- /assembly_acc=CAM_ASM_000160